MKRNVITRMQEAVTYIKAYANGLITDDELEEMIDLVLIHPSLIN
jgi:hypothetical protein